MKCQWCKEEKDETEFHWKWKNVARLKVCKECRKISSRKYRDGSYGKRLAYNKKYVETHREVVLAKGKIYREYNQDKIKQYRIENAEDISEKASEYRQKHKEELRERKRNWSINNRDKNRYYVKKRQAVKNNAEIIDFALKQWLELLEEYDYRCAYCGESNILLQQDHVCPISRGGNHTKQNIVPACISCNSSKKDRPLEQWKRTLYFRNNCANSRK
jgi:5-methylcytosine-specific restriction endonuclease McrA